MISLSCWCLLHRNFLRFEGTGQPLRGLTLACAFVLGRDKSYWPLGRIGWRHELVDRLDELLGEPGSGLPFEVFAAQMPDQHIGIDQHRGGVQDSLREPSRL